MGELTASYLSAATLSLYLVGRAVVPLVCVERFPAIGVVTFAMLISSIAYGVIPAIIGDGKEGLVGKAVFTWRLLLFCIAKSCAKIKVRRGSKRRRGRDVESPWRRIAAAPWPPRGSSAGGAALAWVIRR